LLEVLEASQRIKALMPSLFGVRVWSGDLALQDIHTLLNQ
jgi:hypothetical protein